MSAGHRLTKLADGTPAIDQGEVEGHPITWNPDVEKFHVHALGVTDGTEVLGTFARLANATHHARKLAKEGR